MIDLLSVCIKIAEATNRPTSATIEVRNIDEQTSMVYKIKISLPQFFIITPCSIGLIPPKSCKQFKLQLLQNFTSSQQLAYLFLETAFCMNTENGLPQMDAARGWEEIVSADISMTRIPIVLCKPELVKNQKPFELQCGKNPDVLRKTIVERITSVKERIQREDLILDSILLLLTIFGTGFVVGYMIRKAEAPCTTIGSLCQSCNPV